MDISQEKQRRLRDAIISGVRQGYTKVVEKAVEKTKKFEEKYFIPPTPGDLLDFCHLEKPHYSPLMYACESSNLGMVKVLLKSNASVAFTNQGGLNALHVACIKGNLAVVEALLEASVDQSQFCLKKGLPSDLHIALNARTKKDGWCPLLYATKEGHKEVVRCLLERELASIKQAIRDQEASTEQEHFNPILSCIQITSKKKQNVLHIAAREKRLDCLKELHQYMPPASQETDSLYLAIDKKAWNVLHHACAGGSVEVLKRLLEIFPGLSTAEFLNKRTKPGYTPLLIACQYQKTDIVKYLGTEVVGVDFSACCADSEGADEEDGQKRMTGLHLAAIHDSPEIANLLIRNGCPVDTQDEKGETALHIAVRKASFDVADILRRTREGKRLEQIRNKDNQTPSDIQPEEVIPPEIKKRGKHAEELYRRALRKGKKRIPRCNLLVLGEQRVGKTSLIRLLTGKNFILELDPTHGIDNHVVETVDMRAISTVEWKEVKQEDQARENDALLVTGVVEEMGPLQPLSQQKQGAKKADKHVSEEGLLGLLRTIDQIFSEMERKQRPEPETEYKFFSQFVPPPQHYIHFQPHVPREVPHQAHMRPLPQPRPPTAASIQKDDKPAISRPEPKPDKATEPPFKARVVESHKATVQAADSSTEPKETQIQVDRRLSRRYIQSINRELKSTSRSKKEPTLHLNTYDFAGQKEYRPMHHCFITRRSIYLVVFNLQNLIASGQEGGRSESLEEIRYWLNSIHAHIYSGSDDEKMKRVFLVGTHMSPKNPEQGKQITEEEFKRIHQLLKDTFYNDDHHNRLTNHLQFPGPNNRIFAAIENSYDGPVERKTSGAEALQQKLTETSECLEFLKEEYPLLWLRFEAQLMRMREEKQQGKTSQVVKLSEVIHCAQRCGIMGQDEIDLALQFFHDTGTITCLEKLPTLFLGKMEKKQLADLVLLDPKWLITLMKLVMELEDGAANYKGEDLKNLTKTGIARAALLRGCWEEYFTTDSDILFRQLCLMLQAYCLIYPIRGDIEPEMGCPNRSHSDNHETVPVASPPSLSHSQSDGCTDTAANDLKFLVPCKLPEKIKVKNLSQSIAFYFDFQGFLPVEIFNRFVCLMLARSQARSTTRRIPEFSATCCRFYQVEGCNWQMERGVETDHMLKVSVIPPQDEERLDGYIFMIHNEFLKKICDESDLKGLVYHGGPKVVCQRCEWSGVLTCVKYPDDVNHTTEIKCEECNQQYNTNELLRAQVQKKEKTRKVNHGERQLPADIQSSTVSSSVQSTLDMDSIPDVLRELSEITNWFQLGLALNLKYSTLSSIETDKKTVDERKREMVSSWLQQKDDCKPPSWEALVEALEDLLVKRCDVAKQIKQKYKI